MKKYNEPKAKVMQFEVEDIITVSGDITGSGANGNEGGGAED